VLTLLVMSKKQKAKGGRARPTRFLFSLLYSFGGLCVCVVFFTRGECEAGINELCVRRKNEQ